MDETERPQKAPTLLKTDCRFFDGAKPCVPNKRSGAECVTCDIYDPVTKRILLIKLDAMGDVLRTTFLLPLIHRKWPDCHLTWLTQPEAVPLLTGNPFIDAIWTPTPAILARLQAQEFFAVISPSNDHDSAAYATMARSKHVFGYRLLATGNIEPVSEAARYWFEMGAFDRLRRQNSISYQEIMCRIVDVEESGAKTLPRPGYTINLAAQKKIKAQLQQMGVNHGGGFIGINVGNGKRWPKKMLSADHIVELIQLLKGVLTRRTICLLGGAAEKEKLNEIVIKSTGVVAPDTSTSLDDLGALVGQLDLLITGDTLALHLASALDVPCVALFGPTSMTEIYPYNGLITKIASKDLDCLGCYGDCNKKHHCMRAIDLAQIVTAVKNQLKGQGPK